MLLAANLPNVEHGPFRDPHAGSDISMRRPVLALRLHSV